MGVRYKESTHSVDNLYKYLINKRIYDGLTKFPEISAICLEQPRTTISFAVLWHVRLSPAFKKTIKS